MNTSKLSTRLHLFRRVMSDPVYRIAVLVFAVFFAVVMIWLPQIQLFWQLFSSDTFSITDVLKIMLASLSNFFTQFTGTEQILLIVTSVLIGINISLLIFYVKHRVRVERLAGGSFLGIALSLFGVGCSSCGSVILSSFLGIGAASTALSFLPFRGLELTLGSILILCFSLYALVTKIEHPSTCKVSRHGD